METNPENKAEAERLLGVSEKLLTNRDLNGSKEFAILAQETEPLLEGSDQILAIIEVLLSAEKRVNNHHDWYAILQLDNQGSRDLDVIKKQYRKLALLLHPDKNKYPFADQAFKLVADAWAVFSDTNKKNLYDKELSLFTKVDLSAGKLPVRRGRPPKDKTPVAGSSASERLSTFWTACPYCYHLYEYPKVYEGCCLRCDNCKRAFQAVVVSSLPPTVPGKDAYYCCWGVFPMGFAGGGSGKKAAERAKTGFPHWMPPVFGSADGNGGLDGEADGTLPPGFPGQQAHVQGNSVGGGSNAAGRTVIDADVGGGSAAKEVRPAKPTPAPGAKKRGRPRKYI